jgi:hypothetical protein
VSVGVGQCWVVWAGRGPENNLQKAELSTTAAEAPTLPVRNVWRTFKSFIFWSHERGTIQYDVMVTLILIFVFFSPRLINFNDRPVERNPHSSGVVVYPDGNGEFIYQVEGKAVQAKDDANIRAGLLRIIEPISGSVSISRYETVTDNKGHVIAYKVWVQRE